jgi:uncharacterized protein YmfQ (DUF2313 family)
MSMRTAIEYKRQLQALLPPGRLWDALRADGSLADDLLAALAEEFGRIDGRTDDLAFEVDPRTALELLAEWEEWVGLPEICTGSLATLQQRRAALLQKLTGVGGQSRAYYIAVAASLGYEVTIYEFSVHTCESSCEDPINDETWRFTWRVNAPEQTIINFTCESPCTEPLRAWGNDLLECTIRALAPAHTNVLFGYGG